MVKALFSGTFDPPTLGHQNIIEKAAHIFDELIVAIGVNPAKRENLLPKTERIKLLKKFNSPFSNVEVVDFHGAAAEFAKKLKVDCIVRGLRSFSDISQEMQMAMMNRKLTGIETVFLLPDEKYGSISSSLIRELAFYQVNLREFVSKQVEEALYKLKKPL